MCGLPRPTLAPDVQNAELDALPEVPLQAAPIVSAALECLPDFHGALPNANPSSSSDAGASR